MAATLSGAEYYALIKGAAEGLGIQALARDLGIELTLRIWVDSTNRRFKRFPYRAGQSSSHGGKIPLDSGSASKQEVLRSKDFLAIATLLTC